jgi:hypothetical protein
MIARTLIAGKVAVLRDPNRVPDWEDTLGSPGTLFRARRIAAAGKSLRLDDQAPSGTHPKSFQ